MISSKETIQYQKTGFDNSKYIALQKEKIEERIEKFAGGRLYLEIGGHFLFDQHASRVLAGYQPDAKEQIFKSLIDKVEVIFCVNFKDIINNRQLNSEKKSYEKSILEILSSIENKLSLKAKIVINMCDHKENQMLEDFIKKLKASDHEVYKRYWIDGYPDDTDRILSSDGYGKDDYVKLEKNLILVTGAVSNSGKLSTCMGQIYLEDLQEIKSGYAKFETFPIWNLPIDHPINLAYEAATADIGDFNVVDSYHPRPSVNYNRDVDAFKILKQLGEKFLDADNHIRDYRSPTDMGISNAGFAITDDEILCNASLQEIERRKTWYQEQIDRNQGEKGWVDKCEMLAEKAKRFMAGAGYSTDLKLD